MPDYVLLMKLTGQGARELELAPQFYKETKRVWEAELGGTLREFCALMGEYDFVAVGSLPSADKALGLDLYLALEGRVQTTTLQAFSVDMLKTTLRDIVPQHHTMTQDQTS